MSGSMSSPYSPLPPLLLLPPEVVHNIAAFLLCAPTNDTLPLGPPTALPSILLTHRILYHLLSPVVNPTLWIWRDAFCARFDSSAFIRRCGLGGEKETTKGPKAVKAEKWLGQLENNLRALRFFRRGDVYADKTREKGRWPSPLTWFPPVSTVSPPAPPAISRYPPPPRTHALTSLPLPLPSPFVVPPPPQPQPQYDPNPLINLALTPPLNDEDAPMDEALLTALVMVLEDDGKNARQLVEWGRAREWCLGCMEKRWVEENLFKEDEEGGGGRRDKGWVEENLRNSVVVSVFWGLCDRDTLPSLPRKTLQHLHALLSPVVHNPFRYPSAEYPPQWFWVRGSSSPSIAAAPGAATAATGGAGGAGGATAATQTQTTIRTTHGPYPPLPPSARTRRLGVPYYALSATFLDSPSSPTSSSPPFSHGDDEEEEHESSLTLSHPLLSPPSKLLYFSISELLEPIQPVPESPVNWGEWLSRRDRTAYTRGGPGSLVSVGGNGNGNGNGMGGNGVGIGIGREMGREEYMKEWRRRGERGNTREDVDEVNWGWCARPPAARASARAASSSSSTSSPNSGSSFGSGSKWNFRDDKPAVERLTYANDINDGSISPRWRGKAPYPSSLANGETAGIPKSVRWDTEFWRLHLLRPEAGMRGVGGAGGGIRGARTGGMEGDLGKVKLGRVYEVGSLEGTWVGRMSFPHESSVHTILTSTSLTYSLEGPDESKTVPQLGAYKKPVVMRFWEGHVLRDLVDAASSSSFKTKYEVGKDEEEEEDPFWTSIDPSSNPASGVGDNMLNGWFPGFPGTTKVNVVTPGSQVSGSGDIDAGGEAEVDTEGWDGRRRKVRVRLWNGGRGNDMELLGNESVHLQAAADHRDDVEMVDEAPSHGAHNGDDEGCSYTHTLPLSESKAVPACVWTGHGYTHPPASCPECRTRIKVDQQREAARKQREEKEKRLRRERERQERREVWNRRMLEELEENEMAERAFASVGLGVEDDEETDDEEDEVETVSGVPSSSEEDDDEEDDEEEERRRTPTPSVSVPRSNLGIPFNVDVVDPSSSHSSHTKSTSSPSSTRKVTSQTQGCTGIRSTIIFGTSGEERHGDAFGRYRYYGRVREWDGLVGLLRVPVRGRGPRPRLSTSGSSSSYPPAANSHPYSQFLSKHQDARELLLEGELNDEEDEGDRGMVLFYGYVVNGGESFVGSWRSVGNGDTEGPGWEGGFCVGRRPD